MSMIQQINIMKKRYTVREMNTLTSIIQDEIQAHNDKKISSERVEDGINEKVKRKTGYLMEPYKALLDKQEKIRLEVIATESLIKNAFNLPSTYGGFNKNSFVELRREARQQIEKKHKLINIPDGFEIEKLIYKSNSEDFQEIIKSITKQLIK